MQHSLDDGLKQLATLRAQGAWDQAEPLLDLMLAEFPLSPAVHRAHALLADARGQGLRAIQAMEDACRLDPEAVDLRFQLACLLAAGNNFVGAVPHFRYVLGHQPELGEAWYLCAVALMRLNRDMEALPILREAYRRMPAQSRVLRALAELEFRTGFPADALPLWQALGQSMPNDLHVGLTIGEVLSRLGFHEQALAHYRNALQGRPESHDLWMAIAQAEDDLGDRTAADIAYRKALELQPGWAFPLAGLLALHRGKSPPDLIAQADSLLRSSALADADRALLGYALGKIHDGRGDYPVAMACWHDANAARRRMAGEGDAAALEQRVERTMRIFTRDYFAQSGLHGSGEGRPLFIVGMPRSGTTLTEQIIAAHPQAFGCGELPDISLITRQLSLAQVPPDTSVPAWPETALTLDQPALDAAIDRYLQACTRHAPASASCLVDKAPLNFFHLGLIAAMFPQARVIWCRRDPRDIAISIYSENFALDERLCTRLDGIGHYVRLQERLMRHWQSVLPLPILELDYETLVSAPEQQARRIIDFAGLDWNPACLEFHNRGRSTQTPSRWQVKEPVHTRSVGRWRNYAADLPPFLTALRSGESAESLSPDPSAVPSP
ncbi:MAG: sulfotransferase [Pseudoxanthomonas sp.]